MTDTLDPWTEAFSQPTFVLTSDQDWAPEWAVDAFLADIRRLGIPLHIFRTNPSPALDAAVRSGEVEQGWHPNFLNESSHGTTTQDVIKYCATQFPGAKTVRGHCFAEDSLRWRDLRAAGIVADSHPCTLFHGRLTPVVHWTGIVKFPVYFEDDIFFGVQPDLAVSAVDHTLFTPGLKILNFHPTFIGCNTPSRSFHEGNKGRIFAKDSQESDCRWAGRGSRDVFNELVGRVVAAGHSFVRFHELVDRTLPLLRQCHDVVAPAFRQYIG